jgi:hypothetical protein
VNGSEIGPPSLLADRGVGLWRSPAGRETLSV